MKQGKKREEEMEGVKEGVDDGVTGTFAGLEMLLESLTQNLPLKLSWPLGLSNCSSIPLLSPVVSRFVIGPHVNEVAVVMVG